MPILFQMIYLASRIENSALGTSTLININVDKTILIFATRILPREDEKKKLKMNINIVITGTDVSQMRRQKQLEIFLRFVIAKIETEMSRIE